MQQAGSGTGEAFGVRGIPALSAQPGFAKVRDDQEYRHGLETCLHTHAPEADARALPRVLRRSSQSHRGLPRSRKNQPCLDIVSIPIACRNTRLRIRRPRIWSNLRPFFSSRLAIPFEVHLLPVVSGLGIGLRWKRPSSLVSRMPRSTMPAKTGLAHSGLPRNLLLPPARRAISQAGTNPAR